MSELRAYYTKEKRIFVSWFSELRGREVHATFTGMDEIREMLPTKTAQLIETYLVVNDMLFGR